MLHVLKGQQLKVQKIILKPHDVTLLWDRESLNYIIQQVRGKRDDDALRQQWNVCEWTLQQRCSHFSNYYYTTRIFTAENAAAVKDPRETKAITFYMFVLPFFKAIYTLGKHTKIPCPQWKSGFVPNSPSTSKQIYHECCWHQLSSRIRFRTEESQSKKGCTEVQSVGESISYILTWKKSMTPGLWSPLNIPYLIITYSMKFRVTACHWLLYLFVPGYVLTLWEYFNREDYLGWIDRAPPLWSLTCLKPSFSGLV